MVNKTKLDLMIYIYTRQFSVSEETQGPHIKYSFCFHRKLSLNVLLAVLNRVGSTKEISCQQKSGLKQIRINI